MAVVGTDRAGRDVARLLGEETGVESHLLSTDDRETTVSAVRGGLQQLLRTDQSGPVIWTLSRARRCFPRQGGSLGVRRACSFGLWRECWRMRSSGP